MQGCRLRGIVRCIGFLDGYRLPAQWALSEILTKRMSFLWPRARAGLLSDDGQNDRLTEHLAGSVPWLGAQRREPARRWQKKLTESHFQTHTLTAPTPLHPTQGATLVPYLTLAFPWSTFRSFAEQRSLM